MLQNATDHLSWLMSNGYAARSSLKLVGDRFSLLERQRTAVMRSACSDDSRELRLGKQITAHEVGDRTLLIDGFNLITTVEAAIAGGVILECRDTTFRDMASMHGTYRTVNQTIPALELIGQNLENQNISKCHWLLDRPVSNSGKLSTLIHEIAATKGWRWEAELVRDPDPLLIASEQPIVSADSMVLEGCGRWLNLAREIISQSDYQSFVVPMQIQTHKS